LHVHAFWLHFAHSLGYLLTTLDRMSISQSKGQSEPFSDGPGILRGASGAGVDHFPTKYPFVQFARSPFCQLVSIFQSFSHFVLLLL